MQNFRKKVRGFLGLIPAGKAAACMLSVAMAAIIFWGFTLTGNTDNTATQLTVAESIRAAGDTLTASSEPNKIYLNSFKNPIEIPDDEQEVLEEEQSEKADESLEEKSDDSDKTSDDSWQGIKVIEKRIVDVEETIEHPVEERPTSLLKAGQRKQIKPGMDGRRIVTYEQKIANGRVVSQVELAEEILEQPVEEVVMVGVSGVSAAISPLDFGVELDENGVPVSYSRVLSNQVATGYHAGNGAWGASGQTLSAGYVAVHPGEIPYGTRMYITSPDNSFVYGFAIAADTGISLLNDRIDVDLYYDSYLESCLNGRRNVNIYILD